MSVATPLISAADMRRRLAVLLLIVFVDLLGFGVLIPLIPFYAERLGLTPQWITLVISLHSLMQFVGAPILGRLSDRFGRRPVLALSMAGHIAAYGLLAFADNLTLLVASRLLSGLTSGNLSAAYAYVTDITPPERRADGLGKVSAAFALGFALGPALGGWLAGGANPTEANLAQPAIAAAALSAISLLGILLFLPESHRRDAAARPTGTDAETSTRRALLRDTALALMILLALMVLCFAAMRESLLALWLHDRMAADTYDIGVVFTANGIVVAIVQFWFMGRLARRFGAMQTLRAGVVAYACSWLGLVLAPNLTWVIVATGFGAIGTALFGTSLQTLVSMRAVTSNRGAVMGLYQSNAALARFFGAALSGTLYGSLGQNAPFSIGALMMIPALALTFFIAVELNRGGHRG